MRFNHPYFEVNEGGYFKLDPADRRPVYMVNLGDQTGMVSMQAVRKVLLLDHAENDIAMLDRVGEALRFVPEIHLGDGLPSEIFDGEASWEIEEHHCKIADRRVVAAMVKWSEGWEGQITELGALQQFTEEYVNQEKVARALKRLDKTVGQESHGLSRIQPVLERLTKELSYIEALRETVEQVRRIGKILEYIRRVGGVRAGDTEDVTAVLRLFKPMMATLDERLASVDDQVTDFLAAVSEHETLYKHIQEVRDELRFELSNWEGLLAQWRDISPKNVDLADFAPKVADLYRFLAPWYSPVDEWELRDRRYDAGAPSQGAGPDEIWQEDSAERAEESPAPSA